MYQMDVMWPMFNLGLTPFWDIEFHVEVILLESGGAFIAIKGSVVARQAFNSRLVRI